MVAGSKSQLSVVIPTLGHDCLRSTIEALNVGSVVPNEILVCVPKNEASRVESYISSNVKIMVTTCRGQVAQRAAGFRAVEYDYVLQLDDDMLIGERCVEILIESLKKLGARAAIAPAIVYTETGESVYKLPPITWLRKLNMYLTNGEFVHQPGCVTKYGHGYGIVPSDVSPGVHEVEWVSGGCVIHHKHNLVLEDFFPFSGKAYCEDLIHSFHLKNKGIGLAVNTKATCATKYDPPPKSAMEICRLFIGDLKARRHYVKLSSRSLMRLYLFYFIKLTSSILFAPMGQRNE